MNISKEDFQTGMTALANARKCTDDMCRSVKQALQDAERENDSKKFKKCCEKITTVMHDVEEVGKTAWSAVSTLQKLYRVLAEMDEE